MRSLFRVVKTNPPTVGDFMSNAALQRPIRPLERAKPFLYTGISMYARRDQADSTVRRYSALGSFVAEVLVPDSISVDIRKTLGPGHCTVTGDPAVLLSWVTAVSAVG